MISIEEMQDLLSDMLDELPEAFFTELHGGVQLLPEARPEPAVEGLYTLGEYIEDCLGNSIALYYGSFVKLFGDAPIPVLHAEIRKTLRHEFRHHLESLAGLEELDLQDARDMEAYLQEDTASNRLDKAVQISRKQKRKRGGFFRRKHPE